MLEGEIGRRNVRGAIWTVGFFVVALASAWLASALVADNGFRCSNTDSGLPVYSIYRLEPWGRSERLFFWGHVSLYPLAVLMASAARMAPPGTRLNAGCLGAIIGAPIVASAAFLIQLRATNIFMHLDVCGPSYYGSSVRRGLGVSMVVAFAVAFVVGVFSCDRQQRRPVAPARQSPHRPQGSNKCS